MDTEKSKNKKKIILSIGAILAVLIIIIASSNTGKNNNYNKLIEFVCNKEYSSAHELINDFDSDYKEIENINKYINIRENYDETDEESYDDVLSDLNELGDFQNEQLEADCQSFEKEVSSHADEYNTNVSEASRIDKLIEQIDLKNLTIEDQSMVEDIRDEYDSASEDVKKYVENSYLINSAEDKLEEIQSYIDEAKELDNMISELGTVTLKSKNDLEKIEEAYNDLSPGAKTYVKNFSKYTAAKKTYNELVKQENEKRASTTVKATTTTTSSYYEDDYSYSSTVYWVPNGSVYHTSIDCPSLSRSKTIRSGSISASGKSRACKICGNW